MWCSLTAQAAPWHLPGSGSLSTAHWRLPSDSNTPRYSTPVSESIISHNFLDILDRRTLIMHLGNA